MGHHADFTIEKMDSLTVVIKDVGVHRLAMTVTNDVERVVRSLHENYELGQRRLFYYDSKDDVDEILHDGRGNFRGFRAGGPDGGAP